MQQQRGKALTYDAVGGTLRDATPSGYRSEQVERILGHGPERFAEAKAALKDWRPHRGAGLLLAADGPIAEGTTVALAAPLPVGFAVAACRIVAVVDEPHRWGFAYGTLPVHPESGEELFVVERRPDEGDVVVFRIAVFWRPHELLTRLGAPVARILQRRATLAYLDAMTGGAAD